MPMVAGPATSPIDQATPVVFGPTMMPAQTPMTMVSESFAKDAIISWFRGEFAAANAIIDGLCGHLAHLSGGSEYDSLFSSIHRRRLNWIPILQMQKYHTIADVTLELRRLSEKMMVEDNGDKCHEQHGDGEKIMNKEIVEAKSCLDDKKVVEGNENVMENIGNGNESCGGGDVAEDQEDSPDSEITETGLLAISEI